MERGYDIEGFKATSGKADFGETIQVLTSAANAQSGMPAFIASVVAPVGTATDTSSAPFQDLATEVRYAEMQATPMGVGLIYVYGFVVREGCALVGLSIDAPQPIPVATLRAVVKASLSRLRNGVRPYPASVSSATTSDVNG